jgi:hypothetical protein
MAEYVAWFEGNELVVVDIDNYGAGENPPEGAEFFKILSPNKLMASLTALRDGYNVFESENCDTPHDLEMMRLNSMFNAQKLLSVRPIALSLDPLPKPTLIAPRRFLDVDPEARERANAAKATRQIEKTQKPTKVEIPKEEQEKYGYFLKLVGDFCPGYQFRGESDEEKADNLCKHLRISRNNPEFCQKNPEIRRLLTILNLNFGDLDFANVVVLSNCMYSFAVEDIQNEISWADHIIDKFDRFVVITRFALIQQMSNENSIVLPNHKKALSKNDLSLIINNLPLLINAIQKYEDFHETEGRTAEENKTTYIEFFGKVLKLCNEVLALTPLSPQPQNS